MAKCSKFGVAVFKAANMRSVTWGASRIFQIGMALCTTLIAGCAYVDVAAMLHVAGSAFRKVGIALGDVVNGAVVASEAGTVDGLGRKFTRFLKMASGTLFFEYRVSAAHAST